LPAEAQGCLCCLVYAQRVAGEWGSVASLGRGILDDPHVDAFIRGVAGAEPGLMYALQGFSSRAKGILNEALMSGRHRLGAACF
jgi:hypothetical protein